MCQNIDKNNLLDYLHLAFFYNEQRLKDYLLAFFIDEKNLNVFDNLLKSDEWKELAKSDKQLADEIRESVNKELR